VACHRRSQFRRVFDVADDNAKALRQVVTEYLHRLVLISHERSHLMTAMKRKSEDTPPAISGGAEQVMECGDERLPSNARFACQAIVTQLHAVQIEISGLDKRITQIHRVNADSRRLDTIPGFGVLLSTAVVATMTDPMAFKTGREFAAWIGLVPRQNSTGGKERLGSITKQGDRYLRRLLVVGATSVINSARARPNKYPWVIELLGRRPTKVVAVALANKMARIAWAVLAKGEPYRAPTRPWNAIVLAAA
jgi:transposase